MLPPKWLFLPTWLVYLFVLVAFELVADVLAKQFSINGRLFFAVLSILGYVLANIAWLISLRSGGTLSRGSVIFSARHASVAVIIGLLIYREKVGSYQVVGLVLGIAAIMFLSAE